MKLGGDEGIVEGICYMIVMVGKKEKGERSRSLLRVDIFS